MNFDCLWNTLVLEPAFRDWLIAVGTVGMAITTVYVIRQNALQRGDSFRPVLVLSPLDGIDPLDRSSLLCADPPQSAPELRAYLIPCVLRNIGVGPALNVCLYMRFMGIEGFGIRRELAPLRAGDSRGDADHPLRVQFRPHDGFNDASAHFAPGNQWDLVLEYQDVFGHDFHTIHSKNPQQSWTVCGEGPAPPGVDPAVVNANQAAMSASAAGRDDGPVGPGFGP